MVADTQSHPVAIKPSRMRDARLRRRLESAALYFFMSLLGVLFMFPWFWTVSTSFKKPSELFIFPPLWIPESLRISNYAEVFATVPFARWYLNSTIVVLLTTLGVLASATLVSYSFARFRWPGRDIVFAITLGTMMLPSEIMLSRRSHRRELPK
ncbi:MAG: carbohydrate ABC transporter permease, partial [Chloroflexi bacterium]|nr:carbohydrate ABC transporter permease [Chloroflexota bacterium]